MTVLTPRPVPTAHARSHTPLPRVDQLRFGTGIGVRYHTRFGPIRVDVGTPIDRQPGESRIAVYVSLGQAF